MRAVAQADGGRGARNLLQRDAMFEITQTRAAELFLDGDAVQTDGSHLWPEVARELVRAVDLRCARRDLVLGEIACGRADHVGGFAEIEIEAGGDVGDHRGGLNIENVIARSVATKQSRRKLRRTSVFASGLLRFARNDNAPKTRPGTCRHRSKNSGR